MVHPFCDCLLAPLLARTCQSIHHVFSEKCPHPGQWRCSIRRTGRAKCQKRWRHTKPADMTRGPGFQMAPICLWQSIQNPQRPRISMQKLLKANDMDVLIFLSIHHDVVVVVVAADSSTKNNRTRCGREF